MSCTLAVLRTACSRGVIYGVPCLHAAVFLACTTAWSSTEAGYLQGKVPAADPDPSELPRMASPRGPLRRSLRLWRLFLSSGARFLREGPRTLLGRCPQSTCPYQWDAGRCASVPRGVAPPLLARRRCKCVALPPNPMPNIEEIIFGTSPYRPCRASYWQHG